MRQARLRRKMRRGFARGIVSARGDETAVQKIRTAHPSAGCHNEKLLSQNDTIFLRDGAIFHKIFAIKIKNETQVQFIALFASHMPAPQSG
ncbi:hypothetical protein ABW11_17195 [Pluralibacter gergoviae]|nr:hypothetical protein A8H26_22645 [Pluralibacter gergoviae]KMK02954.1 hypothetical protein ABW08_16690 [Pluralibacter gergoviae]KMK06319.1 hypothetical protein ABW07_18595 [Pluralibacter gergoviae]KMK25029.1 hypothetical protein ABW11_17195 [Pluralibacter gergoviae]OHY69116.1 hypothetical protein BB778_07810 [Pluralibacter gergoviae]